MDLGDTVEYTLAKGKGNKISAEKVTKVPPGKDLYLFGQKSFQVLHLCIVCTVQFVKLVCVC